MQKLCRLCKERGVYRMKDVCDGLCSTMLADARRSGKVAALEAAMKDKRGVAAVSAGMAVLTDPDAQVEQLWRVTEA